MVRFLHTGDWQLGMTRRFLPAEAQSRYTQDRLDAIERLGRIARDEECRFVVVCGDVFESNQVDRRTVSRALEALRTVPVPVLLLPGNHDPLDAASVYRSAAFREGRPEHVRVLEDNRPVEVEPGVEVAGAPWFSKRPLADLAAAAARELEPVPGTTRILVAHGAVDTLSPVPDDPALIRLADAEAALAGGRFHYLALGDRHSMREVGGTGRIRYAGTPEPTDFRETAPGKALVVDVDADRCRVTVRDVGRWRFLRRGFTLNGGDDLDALETWLDGVQDKARAVLKLLLAGTLSLSEKARLDRILEGAGERLASVVVREGSGGLAVVPEDADFTELDLTGFAGAALAELREASPGDRTARDALALLVRLARGRP